MNKDYLLVDGYNIIFAWKKLNKLAEDNIEAAKDALINMLCNYQGVKKMNLYLMLTKLPEGKEVLKNRVVYI